MIAFGLSLRAADGVTIVEVRGDLDATTAPRLASVLGALPVGGAGSPGAGSTGAGIATSPQANWKPSTACRHARSTTSA